MSAATHQGGLFPEPRRNHYFAAVPYNLGLVAGRPAGAADVVQALLYFADGSGATVAMRDEIRVKAGIGLAKYLAVMRWLRRIGAIDEAPEPLARSHRRVLLNWANNPRWRPAEPEQEGPSHRPNRHAGAPVSGAPSAPIPSAPSAPVSSAPVLLENCPGRTEGKNVPSRSPSRPAIAADPAPSPPGTRRDDLAPLPGGGEGPPPRPVAPAPDPWAPDPAVVAAEVAALEATRAEALAAVGGDPARLDRPNQRVNRLLFRSAEARIADLRRGDYSSLAPPKPPPPPALPCGPPPPPKFRPDEAHDVTPIMAAWWRGDRPDPEAVARTLAARYRDPGPITVATYRDAATLLGTGNLASLLTEAERPRTRSPAHYLSHRFAAELAIVRKAAAPLFEGRDRR